MATDTPTLPTAHICERGSSMDNQAEALQDLAAMLKLLGEKLQKIDHELLLKDPMIVN